MVRPTRFDLRRILLRATAPAVSDVQSLAVLRGGMMAVAPRLPVGAASHPMVGSNQIVSEPRCLSALLQAGQFRLL
jgi:hypothetical protein